MSEVKTNSEKYKVILLGVAHFLNDFYNNFLTVILPAVIVSMELSLTLSGTIIMI